MPPMDRVLAFADTAPRGPSAWLGRSPRDAPAALGVGAGGAWPQVGPWARARPLFRAPRLAGGLGHPL